MANTRRRIFLLVDHPRWTLAAIAARLSAWLPQWDLEWGTRAPRDARDFDLVHVLYPPLWARERERFAERTPLLFSFHSERALVALPMLQRERSVRQITVGGVSRAIVRNLARVLGAAHFLPDGVFMDEWPLRSEPDPGPLRVGMVGLLTAAKGFGSLLVPAAREFGFEVVTHWRTPTRVGFPDETLLPPGFIARLYSRMDLYAMLSRSEGTPMPLLEAMASGVAPIATPTGAALELIEEGANGFFVSVRSPRGVRHAFRGLPPDRAHLRELGRVARARVARKRSGEAMVASYARAYRAALGEPPSLLDPLDQGGAIAIVAHPDDETLWMGGLRLLHPWLDWTFVVVTHAAGSPRFRELQSIAADAGAQLVSFEYEDRVDSDLGADLRGRLESLPWDRFGFAFTHGVEGEYGHALHRAVHQEVAGLLSRRRSAGLDTPRLFCFAPTGEGEAIALPPVVAAKKAALLERYRSEGRRTRLLAHAARSSGREYFREVTP